MANETNKVKFGIKNCYYAILNEDENGNITYDTPKRFPGAVNLSLSKEGSDPEKFYADDIVYYQSGYTNTGYEGDFEFARVIDDFHIDVLGALEDDNGMLIEDADVQPKEFALMVQFSGDKHNTRHVLYRCAASRPDLASQTIEETATPVTETLSLTVIPAQFGERHIVKGKASPDSTNYDTFFDAVPVPTFEESQDGGDAQGDDQGDNNGDDNLGA